MADPFVAEIRIFPFNFAPKGWAWCDGQLLPLSQYSALFSLLGTYYGGNGKSNFALPNLKGATTLHPGQGPGLSEYFQGQSGGSDTVTLLESEIPAHTHTLTASNGAGTVAPSTDAQLGKASKGGLQAATTGLMYSTASANNTASPQAISAVGGGLPHNNMMPYLTFYYCIALQGVFPARH